MPHYHEPVYRPPSEAASLIFQVTEGCSHNECVFCYMYRDKTFRAKPWERVKGEIDEAAALAPHVRRIFLADGDAFVLPAKSLERILEHLYLSFPQLQRVTAYATPGNLLKKSAAEMKLLADKGLRILYYGVETGDAELLVKIRKGATREEMIEGCRRATEAGLKLSITVILGLGGKKWSMRHARNTAGLLNQIQPRYLSALTLMLGPYEKEYKAAMGPGFEFNSPLEDVVELQEMIATFETDKCIFRSNHASNYLPLAGTLLADKERLLSQIDAALKNPDAWLRDEWMRGL